MALEFETRLEGYATVMAPRGRVDQVSADALGAAMEPFLAACKEGTPLVLDFSGVPYLSSLGLRVLMLASRRAAAQDGKLAIAALQPLVAEVFRITRFDLVLPVFDSVAAAVNALSGGAGEPS